MEQARVVPEEEINKAVGKLQGFYALKGEIDAGLAIVHERMEEVRQKLRANARNDNCQDMMEMENALLTQGVEKYLGCLEINHASLEQFLRLDEEHWEQHVEQVKRDSQSVENEIQALLAKQASDLQ